MTEALTFDDWRRRGRTYRHRGHDVFYVVEGQGPWLVAVHGFPSASWDWHLLWPALTARFRVVAADMIGFGWSAKPRRYDYSIVDQASLHEGLLRELGVGRAHLLAHDYGDSVAQELLARHGERARRSDASLAILSACFLNGGLFPEMHRPRLVQRLLASPLGPVVERAVGKRGFARGLKEIFGPKTPPSPQFIDELWTLLRHADGHRVLHQLIGYMAERRVQRARWVEPLLSPTVPLRLVDGALDPVSGAHLAARYRQSVPNADVVLLPDVGHYPQIEDGPAVTRAVLELHDGLASAGVDARSPH